MKAAVAQTDRKGRDAGRAIGASVQEQLGGHPDALILFASPEQDHRALLEAVDASCSPGVIVGCSSAGEFAGEEAGFGLTCAVAYRFFGGGAGDDARFGRTYVFRGTEVFADAAVALEILSDKPIGVGVSHGWSPGGARMRVTESEGMTLASLNAVPAAEVFEAHAATTGQRFDRAEPIPFFLHNVLGVESPGGYRLRVPLAVDEAGAVACAADVPTGATSCIMTTTAASAADAAAAATKAALGQLDGHEPVVALLFDCVATRLRLGEEFGAELQAVQRELGSVPFAGFNTYGQIASAEGRFSGFHNCTAVVCVFPR